MNKGWLRKMDLPGEGQRPGNQHTTAWYTFPRQALK